MLFGLIARVGGVALARLAARDVGHIHGDFDFQHVHSVLGLGKFRHALRDDVGLFARKADALLVAALFVADQFEEERNVYALTFLADALHPGVLDLVDVGRDRRACSRAGS